MIITSVEQESMQSLLIKMRFNGQLLSTGTGFIVMTPVGPVLVTNRHNVTGRDQNTGQPLSRTGAVPNEIVITHNKVGDFQADEGFQAHGGWIERTERLVDADEKPLWREHPRLRERADFVALPLTSLDDVLCVPYNVHDVGFNLALGPTELVSVIGFPFGKTAGEYLAIWATGFIASEPNMDYLELPMLLIDCRSRPGQSGSPVIAFRSNGSVVNAEGQAGYVRNGPARRFIGIYSGRISTESDIGMVWKVEAIRELIDTFNP